MISGVVPKRDFISYWPNDPTSWGHGRSIDFKEALKDIFSALLIWIGLSVVEGLNVHDTKNNIGDNNIGAGELQ